MRLLDCDSEPVDPNHDPITLIDGFEEESYICVPDGLELYDLSVGQKFMFRISVNSS
jgi:hypothetical protein